LLVTATMRHSTAPPQPAVVTTVTWTGTNWRRGGQRRRGLADKERTSGGAPPVTVTVCGAVATFPASSVAV
jgi:hypothetical protein